MNDAHKIVEQVYAAKENVRAEMCIRDSFNTLQFDELYGYLLHQSKREGDALLLENGLRIFPGMERCV